MRANKGRHLAGIHGDVDSFSQCISEQAHMIEEIKQQLEKAQQRNKRLEDELRTRIYILYLARHRLMLYNLGMLGKRNKRCSLY